MFRVDCNPLTNICSRSDLVDNYVQLCVVWRFYEALAKKTQLLSMPSQSVFISSSSTFLFLFFFTDRFVNLSAVGEGDRDRWTWNYFMKLSAETRRCTGAVNSALTFTGKGLRGANTCISSRSSTRHQNQHHRVKMFALRCFYICCVALLKQRCCCLNRIS